MTLEALIQYIQTKDLKLFPAILETYLQDPLANLNQICIQKNPVYPLLAAVQRKCVKTTTLLLNKGARADYFYPEMEPILIIAIQQGADINMIDILLEHGALIFALNKNQINALQLSLNLKTTTIFALFLEQARRKQLYDPALDTLIESVVAPLALPTPHWYPKREREQLIIKITELLEICIDYQYTNIQFLLFLSPEQRQLIYSTFSKKLALLPVSKISRSHIQDNESAQHNTQIHQMLALRKHETNECLASILPTLPSAMHMIITDYVWHKEPPPLVFSSLLLDILPMSRTIATAPNSAIIPPDTKFSCCNIL